VLESLAGRLKRRGLIILISDFFDDANALMRAVGILRRKGHELLVFQLWDRDELEFPFSRWSRFENLEQDEDHLMLDPVVVRQSYLKVLAEFRQTLKTNMLKSEVDVVEMTTDQPHAIALKEYLALRMRR
jgi:hypothetical protein